MKPNENMKEIALFSLILWIMVAIFLVTAVIIVSKAPPSNNATTRVVSYAD